MTHIHCMDLEPLNRTVVKAFGAMAELADDKVMARFVRVIICRAADFFQVLEYQGDDESSGPRLWYRHERGYADSLNLHNANDVSRLRSTLPTEANLEGALHLASLEVRSIVPEADECIKLALWSARMLARDHGRWRTSRNRYRAAGVAKHLLSLNSQLTTQSLESVCNSLTEHLFPSQRKNRH